ncbi:MAG: phosphotransferase [Firmicutes bacterium]|nr:phosphotransferase [Bacillota bacterium]
MGKLDKLFGDACVSTPLSELCRDARQCVSINKGWSGDKKFIVETAEGRRLLLRLADAKEYDEKKREFEMMGRVAARGIPTCAPVDFGLCDAGKSVYTLVTWLEGEDAGSALRGMSGKEQYLLGKKAGALLRGIHQVPTETDTEGWSMWFGRRMKEKLDLYLAHERKLARAAPCAEYLLQNKHLLEGRPQAFYHGDLNPTNVILLPGGEVAAIDYNAAYDRHGVDPVWEFRTIPWGQNPNPHYYTGVLDGYYEGLAERDFLAELAVLAYYFAYEAVWGIVDSRILRKGMRRDCRKHLANVLRWFGNMDNVVPTWYLKGRYS